MTVLQFTGPQGAKQQRRLLTVRELGVDIGQNAMGDAYNRIIRDNPDVTSHRERFELALSLALSSLSEAMRYLDTRVMHLTDIQKEQSHG